MLAPLADRITEQLKKNTLDAILALHSKINFGFALIYYSSYVIFLFIFPFLFILFLYYSTLATYLSMSEAEVEAALKSIVMPSSLYSSLDISTTEKTVCALHRPYSLALLSADTTSYSAVSSYGASYSSFSIPSINSLQYKANYIQSIANNANRNNPNASNAGGNTAVNNYNNNAFSLINKDILSACQSSQRCCQMLIEYDADYKQNKNQNNPHSLRKNNNNRLPHRQHRDKKVKG